VDAREEQHKRSLLATVVGRDATGQCGGRTQKELGQYGEKLASLLKYDGEAFEPGEVVEGFESSIDGGQPAAGNMRFVPAAGD